MDRWSGRVAVITGASSGIGAACAKYLANNGMVVVGLARRKERVEDLRKEVKPEASDRLHAYQCDMRKEQEIIEAFKEIEAKYGPIAVLVNNAGVKHSCDLVTENNSEDLRSTIETNVLGVAFCTCEGFRSMKAHGGDDHVFLINSMACHSVVKFLEVNWNIFPSSNYAATAMMEVYRQ